MTIRLFGCGVAALLVVGSGAEAQQVTLKGYFIALSDCAANRRLESQNPGNVHLERLHAYEMIRGGLFGNQIQVFYDAAYLSVFLAVLTLFALWLVRDVRRYVEFE